MAAIAAETGGIGAGRTRVRLLSGLVRKNRVMLMPWVWMVPMLTRTLAKEGGSVTWLMAASMCVAFLLSGIGEAVGCREHRVLPVTDRDLWVTRWLNATLVVPAWLFILKGLGLALAAWSGVTYMTPETFLLSTMYDVVYAGALVSLPLLLPSGSRTLFGAMARRLDWDSLPIGSPQRKRVASATVISLLIVVPLIYLIGIGGPLLLARQLPTHLADFSTASTLLLVTGIAMSLAALIWTPPRGGAPPPQRALSPAAAALPAKREVGDRLTGVLLIIWAHIRSTFVFTVIVIAAGAATVPFMPPDDDNPRIVAGMLLIFMFMGISMFSVWTPWVRRLKVLPLSVTRVNALFVLTPVVTWIAIWLIALFAHVALNLPIPIELSPLAILAYAGLCAVSHALGLWLHGSVVGQTAASMAGFLSVAGVAMLMFETPNQWTQIWLLLIGLASLAVAALINHRTLTRSTSSARAYRTAGLSMKP